MDRRRARRGRGRRPARDLASVLTGLGLVLALVAACGGGAPTAPSSAPISRQATAKGFTLQVSLPASAFAAADAIPVTTTVTWTGPADSARIFGSGMGPVAFLFAEVGGAGRAMGGVMTSDCGPKDFARGVPVAIPFQKSTGFSADDPQAAFYRAWNEDKALHLPVGHWQMAVQLSGYLAPCDQNAPALDITLAPIDLLVQ